MASSRCPHGVDVGHECTLCTLDSFPVSTIEGDRTVVYTPEQVEELEIVEMCDRCGSDLVGGACSLCQMVAKHHPTIYEWVTAILRRRAEKFC